MCDFTVLAMTAGVDWLEPVRHDLHELGGTRVIVTGSMEEACELLEMASACLIRQWKRHASFLKWRALV